MDVGEKERFSEGTSWNTWPWVLWLIKPPSEAVEPVCHRDNKKATTRWRPKTNAVRTEKELLQCS